MSKNKKVLNEDTLGQAVQQAQSVMDNEVTITDEGDIEQALNDTLAENKEVQANGEDEFGSVLLIGHAGVGKTARVKQWCKNHGMNLIWKDAKIMDIGDLRGLFAPNADKTRATNLPTDEFNVLDQPNTVLFLDEFNRAAGNVRFTLSQLINEHKVPDSTAPGGSRFFPNLVMVIAAINPAMYGVYNTDALDAAELDRFEKVQVRPDKHQVMNYLVAFFEDRMKKNQLDGDQESYKKNQGRAELAKTLLSSREFEFDDTDDIAAATETQSGILSPRGLHDVLRKCDGTKEGLLRKWNNIANPNKKGMVERILKNYQDIDDKANSVFKDNPFKNSGTENWKKIQSVLNNL